MSGSAENRAREAVLAAPAATAAGGDEPWRVQTPERTLAQIRGVARDAGVTRLADITGLDRLGLPVFQAIRPLSRNISVTSGKGLTRAQAQVSALMEAIETWHAERVAIPAIEATVGAMRRELPYAPEMLPGRLAPRSSGRLRDDARLSWIPATALATGASTWVPRELAHLDFRVSNEPILPTFAASSNGLASGMSRDEALLHALCEVVERESAVDGAAAWRDAARGIRGDSIPMPIAGLLERIARAGVHWRVVNLTGAIGLPCFEVHLIEDGLPPSRGLGAHVDREVALTRALTEAAQARVVRIAGGRDDLYRELYLARASENAELLRVESAGRYADVSSVAVSTMREAMETVVVRIHRHTGASPLVVDIARTDVAPDATVGVNVLLVIAPGLRRPALTRRGAPLIYRLSADDGPAAQASTPERAGTPEEAGTSEGSGTRRAVLFIGPSLARGEVGEALGDHACEVEIRPPVAQGDLLRLLPHPPEIVAIVDGRFGGAPAVTHKEILLLHERGTTILGAGSMGALRAAELDGLGMEGVGDVWRLFRDGQLEADDEVALVHATEEYGCAPMSDALVSIRHRMQAAADAGILTPLRARLLVDVARAQPYARRTVEDIASALRWREPDGTAEWPCAPRERVEGQAAAGEPREADESGEQAVADWRAALAACPGDVKREDARLLVRELRARLQSSDRRGTQGHANSRSRAVAPRSLTPSTLRPSRTPRTRYLEELMRDYIDTRPDRHYVPAALVVSLFKMRPESDPVIEQAARNTHGLLLRRALGIADGDDVGAGLARADASGEQEAFAEGAQLVTLPVENGGACAREDARHEAATLSSGKGWVDEEERLQALREREAGEWLMRRVGTDAAALDRIAAALLVGPEQLVGAPYIEAGTRSDGALRRALQLTGVFAAARQAAVRTLRDFERLAEVPGIEALLAPERMIWWCARRWHCEEASIWTEARRRWFLDRVELLTAVRLTYLASSRDILRRRLWTQTASPAGVS